MEPFNRRYWSFIIPIALLMALIYYFSQIVTWVVLAWILSLLGAPIMKLLGKIQIGRFKLGPSIKALSVLTVFFAVLGLFFYIFVPIIVEQGQNIAGVDYDDIAESLEEPFAHVNDWFIERGLMDGELSSYAQDSSAKKEEIPADTLGVLLEDSLHIQIHPDVPHGYASLRLDSVVVLKKDSLAPTLINLNLELALAPPSQDPQQSVLDPSAVVKPSDSPLEKFQKEIISFFNPAQISLLFSYIVGWLGQFMILLTSVSFIAFFFLKDQDLFGRAIKSAIPNRYADEVDEALQKIRSLLTRYFAGILAQITVITLYVSTGLSLFGIRNAILIGFFAAIINVVPYLGPLIGGLFAILITISSNLDLSFYEELMPMLFHVVLVFATMQLLDGFVLQPLIFSNSVLAHPLEIFIVVIVGAQLGGIPGMVAAIPIYTVIRVIAAVFLGQSKLVQSLTSQMNEAIEEDLSPPEGPPKS